MATERSFAITATPAYLSWADGPRFGVQIRGARMVDIVLWLCDGRSTTLRP
jgi:hypothetical protein